MKNETKEWKLIPGLSNYMISSLGEIKKENYTLNIRKPNNSGYYGLQLLKFAGENEIHIKGLSGCIPTIITRLNVTVIFTESLQFKSF